MSTPDTDQMLYGASRSTDSLSDVLTAGKIPVSVYGLGKMGLPLAAVYADVTGNVRGVDVDPDVVERVNNGDCHVKREPGLQKLLQDVTEDGSLQATTDYGTATADATVHVVIVPTPIHDDNTPDLSILKETVRRIGGGLDPGDLVVVECTVPPRTCQDVLQPILEAESGLDADEFGLAFCPERTASGRALQDIRGSYPKVVGGIDEESTETAAMIYEHITDNDVLTCSDITVAECVKVFEGLYRDVNIALVNELAKFADEMRVDVNEAIDVANTAPYIDLHTPGAGVGGHCIPYYPYFLIEMFETPAPMLEAAREVNDSMPDFTVQKMREGFESLGRGLADSTVLVLGLTYRPGVEEIRAAPAIRITELLSEAGAEVLGADPLLDSIEEFAAEHVTLDAVYNRDVDGVVVVTPHEEFEDVNWDALRGDQDRLVVVDGRQAYDLSDSPDWTYTIGSS